MPAPSERKPPLPGGAPPQQAQQQVQSDAAGCEDGSAMPAAWQYGIQLAGHCCAAGLLDAGRAAEWAASSRMLLQLPPAGRRQALALLDQCLLAAPLAQHQAQALAEQCLKGAKAAGAASGPAAGLAAAAGGQAIQRARTQLQQQAEQEELQHGLLAAAARVAELHPAAFVAVDEALLQPLLQLGSGQAACVERVTAARRRLSRALHAR